MGSDRKKRLVHKHFDNNWESTIHHTWKQLDLIRAEIDLLEKMNLVGRAEQLIDQTLARLHTMAEETLPESLVNLGLKDAVMELGHRINTTYKVQVITRFHSDSHELSHDREMHLYRIIQSVLNQACAKSSQRITIEFTENQAGHLLVIEDDSTDLEQYSKATREEMLVRIGLLKGSLRISADGNAGSRFEFSIPFE